MGKREKAARERRLLTREQLSRAAAATEGSGGGAGRGQSGRLEEGLKEVQRVLAELQGERGDSVEDVIDALELLVDRAEERKGGDDGTVPFAATQAAVQCAAAQAAVRRVEGAVDRVEGMVTRLGKQLAGT